MFFTELAILSSVNFLAATPRRCISMTNQECKVRPELVNVNSNEPVFYPFSIKKSKCSWSCNNISDSNTKMCVPDVDKSRCECKELIDKGICDKGFIWNPSNCEYECDKSCDIGKYLDYENCKCRKKLVDKLTEECNENIGEVKNSECNSTECNSVERIHKCSSCTQFLHIVLFSIIFTINIGIATYSVYYKSMYRNKENVPRYN